MKNYPHQTFDPYVYSLAVLLNRVRGFLVLRGEHADIIVESRGKVEDHQIKEAYVKLITEGSHFGDGAHYQQAYPEKELIVRRKDNDIAGLQLADIFAFGQKVQTILENNKPFPRPLGNFDKQLTDVVGGLVNRFGRYFLE